jgi:DNA-binding transcriptional ArsR family regulator
MARSQPAPDRLLDDTLMALADPTRREILRRLARSDARVTALAEPFPISLNSISKHIRLLERAGLVVRRRVGREHILRFRSEPMLKVQEWISRQEAFWRAGMKELDTLLNQTDETREKR